MKLNEIITYCNLKDLIKDTSILSKGELYEGGEHHIVRVVVAKNSMTHVNIIYRSNGGTHAALVYAEIVYTGTEYIGTPNTPDRITKVNAKMYDIKNEIFGYGH